MTNLSTTHIHMYICSCVHTCIWNRKYTQRFIYLKGLKMKAKTKPTAAAICVADKRWWVSCERIKSKKKTVHQINCQTWPESLLVAVTWDYSKSSSLGLSGRASECFICRLNQTQNNSRLHLLLALSLFYFLKCKYGFILWSSVFLIASTASTWHARGEPWA